MQLVSYLFFENQASEAFDFYAKCLGGKLDKITFGEMPGSERMPAATRDLIAHARLAVGRTELMASDWCPPSGEPYPGIHGSAVSIHVDKLEQAERLFAALGDGGKVTMPIGETSWALRFGMLVDRFGAMWMVNCNKPQ
jgi:PhnB protein